MDAFDSMLRERLVRLIAVAPGHEGPLPVPPGRTATTSRLRAGGSAAKGLVTAFAGVATVLVVMTIVGGAWLVMMPRVPAGHDTLVGTLGDPIADRIVWDSGLVRLEAESVRIETPNGTFRAIDVTPITDADIGMSLARRSPSPEKPSYERYPIEYVDFVVSSDPGSRHYRTLEVYWQEHGVQMRMFIYFAADDTHWWATEVRVYDGGAPGDWIGWGGAMAWTHRDFRRWDELGCGYDRTPAAGCPDGVDIGLFRSRHGESWTGDLDLLDGVGRANGAGRVTGELHIKGMRLSAFGE